MTQDDENIRLHARKSLLFNNNNPWIKKCNDLFDVTMGAYGAAEVCGLIGIFMLNILK